MYMVPHDWYDSDIYDDKYLSSVLVVHVHTIHDRYKKPREVRNTTIIIALTQLRHTLTIQL